jgi:hypothetical protein
MDILYYLFAAATGVAAVLCGIAIWAPRDTKIKVLALAVMTLFMPVVYVQFTGLLARPKPAEFAWFERNVDRAEVLSASFDEGRASSVWLGFDGMIEPRLYKLPWRKRFAEDLEDAMLQAAQKRAGVIIKKPFSKRALEQRGSTSIEILPPPTPPMKRPVMPPSIHNPRSPEI